MIGWTTTKAGRVLAALRRIGWGVSREVGAIRVLARDGWANCAFPFDDDEDLGPKLLGRLAKRTGLKVTDLTYDLAEAAAPLIARIQTAARQDAKFRQELRVLGRALAALTDDLAATTAEHPKPAPKSASGVKPLPPVVRGPLPAPPPIPPAADAPARPLVRPVVPEPEREPPPPSPPPPPRPVTPQTAASPNHAPIADDDLPQLAEKFQLKAEGARWAAERLRKIHLGANYQTEIEPRDRELIDEANFVDCFLWMINRAVPSASEPSLYDQLAGCFDACAAAVRLILEALSAANRNDLIHRGYELTAEAQSALRKSVMDLGVAPDSDQGKLFQWLRSSMAERGIWVNRYMKQDDQADPGHVADLLKRIRQLTEAIQLNSDREKARKKLFQKIRYHSNRVDDPKIDAAANWGAIFESVDKLVADGLPSSNTELREVLLTAYNKVPEGLTPPRSFRLVAREIDKYVKANPPRPPEPPEEPDEEPSDEVRKAADLVRGKTLVLIGGDPRPHLLNKIKNALELGDVDWVETREHSTFTVFEPHVARPEVAAVLLAIRWASHSYGEVKEYCDKYQKPLVRLPAGLNPNQIAYQILNQAGNLLTPAAAEEVSTAGEIEHAAAEPAGAVAAAAEVDDDETVSLH